MRGQGSAEAARCEDEFKYFVSRYHIRRVRLRLLGTAAGILLSAVEPLLTTFPNVGGYIVMHTVVPCVDDGDATRCTATTSPYFSILELQLPNAVEVVAYAGRCYRHPREGTTSSAAWSGS